jgi:hypothetical protein
MDLREALYINVNHFFVIFGCIALTLYFLYLQMNWRASMNQSAFAVALLAQISLLLFPIIALATFIVLFLCRTECGGVRPVGDPVPPA